MTLPLVIVLAIVLVARAPDPQDDRSRATAPVTVSSGSPTLTAADSASCEKVVEALPFTLDGRKPRVVHGTSPAVDTTYVVAWGEPAVILSCGVARPKDLAPGSAAFVVDLGRNGKTVEFFPSKSGADTIFTSIDRSVYISVRVPGRSQTDPMPILAEAIATALPAVCQAVPQPLPSDYDPSNAQLCVNRP